MGTGAAVWGLGEGARAPGESDGQCACVPSKCRPLRRKAGIRHRGVDGDGGINRRDRLPPCSREAGRDDRQIDIIKALIIASETQGKHDESGVYVPELSYIHTARNIGTKFYPRAIEILQQVGGGGFVQAPSGMEDFYGPISKLMHLYFEGAAVSAEKKVQLLKLAWDLVGSPLGSRHELYERFYAGDPVRAYASQYVEFDKERLIDPIWKLLKETSKSGPIAVK